jgi:biopolymer transport protein ExbD
MRAVLDAPDAEKQIQEPRKPAAPGAAPAPAAPAAGKPKGAAAKLEPAGLLGFWRGKINGEDLMISFHRPPVETDVQVDLYFGRATIGTPASFTIAPDGGSVALMMHSANGRVPFGTMTPGDAGVLKLALHNRQQGQTEVLLTRDREEIATEPQQKEARELFAMWKVTANDDGTIPGTFIGMLAEEVRAYVKANPNLDSGMKLPKLLPRFVTSRDWTAEEAIKLLDDVAYYATAPIEARVAKAKLPSGALWRTMVPFEDIPVAIAKWSEAKDGMRIGMRVVEGDWRIGGKVRVELWLHNAGEKDVSFKTTGPDRQDAGVAVSAVGADGREHWAENGNVSLIAIPLPCTLPAGHVAMAKNLTLSFDAPDNKEQAWFAPKFRDLAPGKYKLRCQWSDPHPLVSIAGDWTGVLTAPELEFTLVAADAPAAKTAQAKPAIEHATVDVAQDGAISFDRKKVTLDELKARAAKNAKKWFTIRADKNVPYAKVIEVVEALKAAGVTEFSFSEARVGDGKYRVANRQDSYKFDDKHHFSICRPSDYPQFFTVSWPAEGERPACWLRTYPNVSGQTQGKWAVVWEPGTNVLWWVDDSDVGKMTLTDPARVIVDREGRTNNFSRDFGLPEEVKTEFRRLGFVVGRDKTPGLETAIGGNTGGQSIVSAEFGAWSIEGTVTDADGKPLANVPVRVSTNQELKTEKTNAKGEYHAYFTLSLQLLARWRRRHGRAGPRRLHRTRHGEGG